MEHGYGQGRAECFPAKAGIQTGLPPSREYKGKAGPTIKPPRPYTNALSNNANIRAQALSAWTGLYTFESGGHQPCMVPA
ncbi:hypothetical protein C8J42_101345 [Sphingomonas sp. PP-CE-1A-559]|nr:hypothetical protein C8J42_101345 [Sphingomonas sp. PP-CE-1A-559]